MRLKPWTVVIRGRESGSNVELTWCRFWTRASAYAWVAERERDEYDDLVEWMVVRR
jgi:hypothetical protein